MSFHMKSSKDHISYMDILKHYQLELVENHFDNKIYSIV